MIDRRGFLGAAAGGIAGASPLARFLASSRLDRLGKIGVQLYTIRDALKADFEGSLARVAEIGYREVEFAGYFDHPARDVRRILHRHGLAAPAAHISLEDIRTRWARTLDDAHTIHRPTHRAPLRVAADIAATFYLIVASTLDPLRSQRSSFQ